MESYRIFPVSIRHPDIVSRRLNKVLSRVKLGPVIYDKNDDVDMAFGPRRLVRKPMRVIVEETLDG
jgi:hypothetical protein